MNPGRFLLLVCSLSLGFFRTASAATELPGLVQRRALPTGEPGRTGFTLLAPSQTGVLFTNQLSDWAAAENRVLSNGSGIAAGDFDNDGWVDLFFCSLNNENRLFRNLGHWRFEEVTARAGLAFQPDYYRGAVFADLDGDGALDLLVGTASHGVHCFLNDGHGKFKDATREAGATNATATETLALADVDGNGTLDLYVANNRPEDIRDWLRIPVMLVNKKPTVPPQLKERLTFESGQLQEFGEADALYLNDGHGKFTALSWTNGAFLDEAGKPLTAPPLDWGLTATFRDINGDGAPDLYVCNDYWTPDRFWLNTGDGHFRAAGRLALRRTSASSMGADFADINRDGLLDLFVVDMLSRSPELRKRQMVARRPVPTRIGDIDNRPQSPQNTLFLNRGDGTFAEIACLAGVVASEWSWSPLFLDVDLDGYDDLLITAGHRRDIQDIDANDKIRGLPATWRNQKSGAELQKAFIEAKREHAKLYPALDAPIVAFRNRGDLRFEEMTSAWGLAEPGVNHGIVAADLDNDGDLDLVVSRLGAPAAVFRNESTAPRLAVRLKGKAPNTQAIGAKLELLGGAVSNQTTEIVAGGSYMAGSEPLRVFALGAVTKGLRLRVTWRSGARTELAELQPNSLYEISESTNTAPARPRELPNSTAPPPFFQDVSPWLAHRHAEEPFDDFQRQPLLPRKLSQAGPGVAWFDLNADGWDDLIIGSGKGGSLAVFVNKNGTAFERLHSPAIDAPAPRDHSTILGLRHDSGQARLLVGNDTYEDGHAVTNILTLLDSNGQPLEQPFPGHAHDSSPGPMALADVDGDGDLDLFVGGRVVPGKYPQPSSSLLFLQTAGQWKLDTAATAALKAVGLVNGAVWSDLNHDGFPELVLACEWGPIRVFQNQAGKLRDVTSESGLANQTGLWLGVSTGDVDGDGELDIIAGNWGLNSHYQATPSHPLSLYYGDLMARGSIDILEAEFDPSRGTSAPRHLREFVQGALPFVAERFPTHLAWSRASMADVLGERASAVKELAVNTLASMVFLNRHGKFEARPLPVEAQFAPAFAITVADLDGDGNEDLFLSQNFFAFRGEESRLDAGRALWLEGDGQGNFRAVSGQISGINVYGEQRAAAAADFDHDGRMDLVVTQNGALTRLYKNARADPGLRVRLQGPAGNRDGIGTILRLRFGSNWGAAHEIHAGSGYWSQDSAVSVLGLRAQPTAIQARWPGGRVTEQAITPPFTEIDMKYHAGKSSD